jgi:CubicO group peptidase (beta-lactamase class C family)
VSVPRRLLVALVAALLLVRVPGTVRAADDLGLALFEQYLDALRRQAGIPGLAVAIVGDNDIAWDRGLGQQDVERAIPVRPDTPFHIDGLTRTLTSVLALRCTEENRLALDAQVGAFDSSSSEPNAMVGDVLTMTRPDAGGRVFSYEPERFKPFARIVRTCAADSYRETLANLFDRFAMRDSVPGPDAVSLEPPAEGIPSPQEIARYKSVLERLATPYAIDKRGRATRSDYTVATLSPYDGVISTVRDLARFDLALRRGALLRGETLAAAWRPPVNAAGDSLPHGIGWFVQGYKNETVVWQFGVSDRAASALLVHIPGRHITVIMLANGDALVRPFPLEQGDLTVSPFGRLILRLFVG